MEYDVLLNIDDFINGPEIEQNETSFQNVDLHLDEVKVIQSLIEGRNSKQSAIGAGMIRELQTQSGLDDALVTKAATKLYSFLDLMGDRIDIRNKILSLGNTTEESIVVDFSPEKNMRLVIYYKDGGEDDVDVEEAFLDYEIDGEYYLMNNTLFQIAERIKQLLP